MSPLEVRPVLGVAIKPITIHPKVAEAIKEHSQQQAAKGGYEAVGYVTCKYLKPKGIGTLQFHNHAPDPKTAFFVEPWEQYRAEKKMEQQGYDVLGVYHSHVRSEALPSESDHALARPGEYVLIYSCVFDELRAYQEEDGILHPVDLIYEEV